MSFIAVSSASAAPLEGNPLFRSTGSFPYLVIGTSGPSVLRSDNGLGLTWCEKDLFHGFVLSSLLIGNAFFHYLNCIWLLGPQGEGTAKAANGCAANSAGTTGGLILTNTLHGILGLILPSEKIGILFLPASGKTFVTFARSTNTAKEQCSEESAVTGSIAALVTPTGSLQTTGKAIAGLTNGFQNILDIDLTHGLGLVKPALNVFSTAAGLEQEDNVTYTNETEVT
ncbi:MAG: hypothetical protein ABR992_02495 [Solirubrobacteraceae bacterium]|jgi:hypothetical protein